MNLESQDILEESKGRTAHCENRGTRSSVRSFPTSTRMHRGIIRALFVAAEIFPMAKTGGLGDVCSALPAALAQLGVDVRLMMPAYPRALETAKALHHVAQLPALHGLPASRILFGLTPDTSLPLFLLDCPELFQRSGGLYQDLDGRDWQDNAQRFALLNRAAAAIALGKLSLNWRPDIVHGNDWHAGLVPAYLSCTRGPRPATMLTIHNLAFQGIFPAHMFDTLGLPRGLLSPDGIEFHGSISYLKAGIRFSDKLTTVSPTYAREIVTPEYGSGLDGLLRSRADDLVGILNGIDENIWNPANDSHLPEPYDARHLEGKAACKAHVQQELHLCHETRPLIAVVSRLTPQKMSDVVAMNIGKITAKGAQLAVLGEGTRDIESTFKAAVNDYPGRVAVHIGYEEPLAHRVFAGADVVLAPARFEPCGLTPIYAMRYGALPVVRRTGGMADTVTPTNDEASEVGAATGFAFKNATSEDMLGSIADALGAYKNQSLWGQMKARAMDRETSWTKYARQYLSLYVELVEPSCSRQENQEGANRPGRRDPGGARDTAELDAQRKGHG
jgi:starch synthase